MANLTRTNSVRVSALVEGHPIFSAGTGRFTIGITSHKGITYNLHLTAAEAQRFVAYVDERAEA